MRKVKSSCGAEYQHHDSDSFYTHLCNKTSVFCGFACSRSVSKLLFWYDIRWFASVTFITCACWHNRSRKHEITPFRWNGFSMEESRVIKSFRIESALLTTNKHAFGGMDFREVVKLFIFSRHDVNDTVSSVVFTSLRRISHCHLLFPKSPVLVSEWNPTWGERDESTVPYFAQFLAR